MQVSLNNVSYSGFDGEILTAIISGCVDWMRVRASTSVLAKTKS